MESSDEESDKDDLEDEPPKKRANRGQVLSIFLTSVFRSTARFLGEAYFHHPFFRKRGKVGRGRRRVQRRPGGRPRTQLRNLTSQRRA